MTTLPTKWTWIYSNHGLIYVQTCTGYRRPMIDLNGVQESINEDCTDEELGELVLLALSKSMPVPEESVREFFGSPDREEDYEKFVSKFMSDMGIKDRYKAFKNMKVCHLQVKNGILEIKPSTKERGEAWSYRGLTEEDKISIYPHSNAMTVGQSVKAVLSKCK